MKIIENEFNSIHTSILLADCLEKIKSAKNSCSF